MEDTAGLVREEAGPIRGIAPAPGMADIQQVRDQRQYAVLKPSGWKRTGNVLARTLSQGKRHMMQDQARCRTLGTRGLLWPLLGLLASLLAGPSNSATAASFQTAFQELGGIVIYAPSCARVSGGKVTCAVVGADRDLFGIQFDPVTGTTTGYQALGGIVSKAPSCAPASNDEVTCAVVGVASDLFGIRFDPATDFTTGYQALGGVVTEAPSCTATGAQTGEVTCAVVGRDYDLFGIRFDPATDATTGYQPLGGNMIIGPSCAAAGRGRVTCAAIGTSWDLVGSTLRP